MRPYLGPERAAYGKASLAKLASAALAIQRTHDEVEALGWSLMELLE